MTLIREQDTTIKPQITSSISTTTLTKTVVAEKGSFNAQLEQLLPGQQKEEGLHTTNNAPPIKSSPNKEDTFKTEITPKKEDNKLDDRKEELDRQIKLLQDKIISAQKYNDSTSVERYMKQLKPLLVERQNLDIPFLPATSQSMGVMPNTDGQDILSLPVFSSPLMLRAGWVNDEKPLNTLAPKNFVDFSNHVVSLGSRSSLQTNHIDISDGGYKSAVVSKQIPSLSSPTRRQAETIIKGAVENSAKKYNLTQDEAEKLEKYSKSIAVQESGMNVNVKDGDNGDSHGMFQINSPAHPDYDVERGRKDPKYNTQYGVDFLASLHKKHGSWEKAVER